MKSDLGMVAKGPASQEGSGSSYMVSEGTHLMAKGPAGQKGSGQIGRVAQRNVSGMKARNEKAYQFWGLDHHNASTSQNLQAHAKHTSHMKHITKHCETHKPTQNTHKVHVKHITKHCENP